MVNPIYSSPPSLVRQSSPLKVVSTLKEKYDIAGIDFFQQLTFRELLVVKKYCKLRYYKKGEIIFYDNKVALNMYLLLSGRVKEVQVRNSGKEIIKSIIYPKDIFGELAIYENEVWEYVAEAMDDVKLYSISKQNLLDIFSEIPGLEHLIATNIIAKFKLERIKMEAAIFNNSKERVITFLKDNANKIGKPIGYEILITHNLTHLEIAQLTYSSRQVVTGVLNELRRLNLIHIERGKILIRDINKLNQIL